MSIFTVSFHVRTRDPNPKGVTRPCNFAKERSKAALRRLAQVLAYEEPEVHPTTGEIERHSK